MNTECAASMVLHVEMSSYSLSFIQCLKTNPREWRCPFRGLEFLLFKEKSSIYIQYSRNNLGE